MVPSINVMVSTISGGPFFSCPYDTAGDAKYAHKLVQNSTTEGNCKKTTHLRKILDSVRTSVVQELDKIPIIPQNVSLKDEN